MFPTSEYRESASGRGFYDLFEGKVKKFFSVLWPASGKNWQEKSPSDFSAYAVSPNAKVHILIPCLEFHQ